MQRLRQLAFASLECDRKKRREIFPERMNGLIPWARLEARIAPTHPKGGGKGRQPYPLSVWHRPPGAGAPSEGNGRQRS